MKKRYGDPYGACARKWVYDSWAEADEVARLHAQEQGHLVLAYQCIHCEKWHNGTPPKFAVSGHPADENRSLMGRNVGGMGSRSRDREYGHV